MLKLNILVMNLKKKEKYVKKSVADYGEQYGDSLKNWK